MAAMKARGGPASSWEEARVAAALASPSVASGGSGTAASRPLDVDNIIAERARGGSTTPAPNDPETPSARLAALRDAVRASPRSGGGAGSSSRAATPSSRRGRARGATGDSPSRASTPRTPRTPGSESSAGGALSPGGGAGRAAGRSLAPDAEELLASQPPDALQARAAPPPAHCAACTRPQPAQWAVWCVGGARSEAGRGQSAASRADERREQRRQELLALLESHDSRAVGNDGQEEEAAETLSKVEAELEGDAIDDPLGLGDEDPYSRLDSAVVVDAAKQHLAERARRAEQWSRLSMEERLEAGPEDSDAAPPPRSVFNASGARRRGYRLQDSLLESTGGFGWEELPEEELKESIQRLLRIPGFDPGTGEIDARFHELMTIHANLTAKQVMANCALREAVQEGADEEVARLINAGGADANQPMPDFMFSGETGEEDSSEDDEDVRAMRYPLLTMVWPPLHWAAALGRASTIRTLVSAGADVEGLDATAQRGRMWDEREYNSDGVLSDAQSREKWNLKYNMTALHWAAYHGHEEAVHMLCQLGASVLRPDARNRTAIEIAAYRRLDERVRARYDAVLAALRERLVEETGGDGWEAHWPRICDDAYLREFEELPDDPEEFTAAQRAWLEAGWPGDDAPQVDLDAVFRAWRATDDPTVAKNEGFYEREASEHPEHQLTPIYVPGKPFVIKNRNLEQGAYS